MRTLAHYKEEQMKDHDFAQAYEKLRPEMELLKAMIDAREASNMTQQELSRRTGIAQTEISRIENGTRSPSIKLLQRLAHGMGMNLKISFEPQV